MAIGNRMISVSTIVQWILATKVQMCHFSLCRGRTDSPELSKTKLIGKSGIWQDRTEDECIKIERDEHPAPAGYENSQDHRGQMKMAILSTYGQLYDPLALISTSRTFATSRTIAGILRDRIEDDIIMDVIMDNWIWWWGSQSQPRAHLQLAGHLVEQDMIIVSSYGQCYWSQPWSSWRSSWTAEYDDEDDPDLNLSHICNYPDIWGFCTLHFWRCAHHLQVKDQQY